jgi:hypothetical protein
VAGQQDDMFPGNDVLEQGRDRWTGPHWWRAPSWWPPKISRAAAILSVVALVLGLGVGYLAGSRHPSGGTAAPAPAASGRASAQPASAGGGPTLEQASNQCSVQRGSTLQLGVEVSNLSGQPLTLGQIQVVLPLGGLRATTVGWGACGEMAKGPSDQLPSDTADRYLPPGASGWLNATVQVLVRCPLPDPVQFSVGYVQHGVYRNTLLPGFPDLTGVAYSGCRT